MVKGKAATCKRMNLLIHTDVGTIVLMMRPTSSPKTVAHIRSLVSAKLYDGCSFYRSDFVIQCGLHGSKQVNNFPDISANESQNCGLSNVKGTASVAHFDGEMPFPFCLQFD